MTGVIVLDAAELPGNAGFNGLSMCFSAVGATGVNRVIQLSG
jgi:hypothetical protein